MRYPLVPDREVIVEFATYLGETATVSISRDLDLRSRRGRTAEVYIESVNYLSGKESRYKRNNSSPLLSTAD